MKLQKRGELKLPFLSNIFVSVSFCRISYLDIFKIVEMTCEKHKNELVRQPSLDFPVVKYFDIIQPCNLYCYQVFSDF
jgi:hypothetical protein